MKPFSLKLLYFLIAFTLFSNNSQAQSKKTYSNETQKAWTDLYSNYKRKYDLIWNISMRIKSIDSVDGKTKALLSQIENNNTLFNKTLDTINQTYPKTDLFSSKNMSRFSKVQSAYDYNVNQLLSYIEKSDLLKKDQLITEGISIQLPGLAKKIAEAKKKFDKAK